MKISKILYGTSTYHKDPVFRVWCDIYNHVERTIGLEELIGAKFLCRADNDRVFVSGVLLYGDENVFYVDDVADKCVHFVSDLKEIYLIEIKQ